MTGARALLPVLLGLTLALPGCDAGIRSESGDGLEKGRQLTAAERARMRAVHRGEILREERPFYGAAVEVERGQVSGTPLPRRLEGARGVSLSLPGQAHVETIAGAITAATDLPVNIRTRYVQPDGSVVRVPIGTKMAVDGYEGPLSAFLDRLSARMDVAWSYDGSVVTIDRMTRRTWRVALPLGVTEMSDSADLAQGAVSVTTSRQFDPWQELEDRLAPMAPPPAAVTVSRETGRVEVFGPPSVLKSVGEVLDDVAEVAAMRVGLEVAVYWVSTTRADESGFGISASRDFGPAAVTLAAAAAGDATGGLLISRGASTLDFKALASDSAVVDYRIANTVVQSGVVAPIALTTEQNYVYSVSYEPAEASGSGGGAGTPAPGSE
ncbi:MAG: secretion protein, partial [Gemmatimonadetes bacterium]|nr:secretion protein [Gemmatimonadota bacterium]